MRIHVAASLAMLARALRVTESELRRLDAEEMERVLLAEVYARFPDYSEDVDGNGPIQYTIVRRRRYELVIDGPSLQHVLKRTYRDDFIADLTCKNSPFLALIKKRAVA